MSHAELRRAFLGSSYGTATQRAYLSLQPSTFCPDYFCPEWATRRGYAILTAWNPNGKQSTTQANHAAQANLQNDLAVYTWQPGHNGEGQWQESTFIVAGIGLRQARMLGLQYQQAAIIWGTGRRAALVWCEGTEIKRLWWSQQSGF